MRAFEAWVTGPYYWSFPLLAFVAYLSLALLVLGPYRKSR